MAQRRLGNYLGKATIRRKTHYIVFDKLSSLSLDASLIGHWNLTPWMEIRVGGGLGIGVVFGNLYQITDNSGCTLQNANDPSNCYPRPVGPIPTLTDNTRRILESNACEPDLRDSTKDTVLSPCYRRIDTYPFSGRVVPVLNTLLGFRFRAHRNVLFHRKPAGVWLASTRAGPDSLLSAPPHLPFIKLLALDRRFAP